MGIYQFPRGKRDHVMRFWAQELAHRSVQFSLSEIAAGFAQSNRKGCQKRASDIALAITALVPLFALMSMTALAIRLSLRRRGLAFRARVG